MTQQRRDGTTQQGRDGTTSPLTPDFASQQEEIIGRLGTINQSIIAAPRRSAEEGIDELLVKVVQVVTVGTPVRGPDVKVPKGYTTLVRQRAHVGTPVGYVAGSQGSVRNNQERFELQDGESVTVNVSNLKNIWVDADSIPAAGFFIELIVTQ